MSEPLDDLWAEFKRTGSPEVRAGLVAHYASLVRYVASQVSTGMPQWIEQSDLTGYGTFGLIDAIEKFELERGIKFETYAITRIRGAIMDELRSIDWVPRSLRAKIRAIKLTARSLEDRLLRRPTTAELAAELDLEVDELEALYTQVAAASMVPLDDPLHSQLNHDSMTFGETVPDRSEPEADVDITAMGSVLAMAIGRLNEREQLVITHYYCYGHTLAEIGQVLGVTESRVCQIHTKAVLRLRSQILD